MPELREAIADKLARDNGLTYDPAEEIIVTTGAQEALAVVMQTLLDPGDEVLLASPYYGAYAGNILLAGGVPVAGADTRARRLPAVRGRRRGADHGSDEAARDHHAEQPDGERADRDTLESLAKVAIDHDLPVLSDELYEKVVYDGFEHVSIASFDGMRERTIVVNGFSKSLQHDRLPRGLHGRPGRLHPERARAKALLLDLEPDAVPACGAGRARPARRTISAR